MNASGILKNGRIVNRLQVIEGDLLFENGRISQVGGIIQKQGLPEYDLQGKYVIPGIIDDQVHFREPGLTHKACIETEARAAVAGGITSFMEMPNTQPTATTQQLLQDKYDIAARTSVANYSFYMGVTNDNLEEALRTSADTVCGLKVFMGSSTGNMLVDDPGTLESLFASSHMLIATHCEDEATIRQNMERYKDTPNAGPWLHPIIRNEMGCLLSSQMAVDLAHRHNTRLHVLHISTADELALFQNDLPLHQKRITAEVCVHHLFFNSDDYATKGNGIKCNPAIKSEAHRAALLPALLEGKLDVVATDHAPHTREEKAQDYWKAPSGLPLVQHSLNVMLSFVQEGLISMEQVVEKMCHNPAICFRLQERGFLDEGNWADMVVVDPGMAYEVTPESLLSRCGWSPFDGHTFTGGVTHTFVNGVLAYANGAICTQQTGQRLCFKPL